MASGPHRCTRPRWTARAWSATERNAALHARRTHVRAIDVSGLSKHAIERIRPEWDEASFGSYDVDETAHTVTHHVQGSITGDLLVGKDLPRRFEFTPDGHLIIRSTRPDEHWFVTWTHY